MGKSASLYYNLYCIDCLCSTYHNSTVSSCCSSFSVLVSCTTSAVPRLAKYPARQQDMYHVTLNCGHSLTDLSIPPAPTQLLCGTFSNIIISQAPTARYIQYSFIQKSKLITESEQNCPNSSKLIQTLVLSVANTFPTATRLLPEFKM